MSSKAAPSPEILRSHEAAFIEHYSWLIRWALQLTKNDRAHAEDLVQEVFAQLAFRHTDLSSVHNIPAYLYTALRNIHVSEIRLANRSHIHLPSIVEYNLAATALAACDPHDQYQTQDQLRRICYYACVRKQSSRAGSVMILRFFFGYHLSEVAQVLGRSCQAVRQCLRFARNEARAFLDDPYALAFIDRTQPQKIVSPNTVRGAEELLADLRLAILRSNQGECLNSDLLNAFYQNGLILKADNSIVAHIVSCRRCLDLANRALDLPLLAERHAADALGPDNSSRRGPGAPGGSEPERDVLVRQRNQNRKVDIPSSFLLRCRRRARELFEHHPQELCVSVNGHLLGSQTVNSEISRLRLDITIPESLSFIEILSEENARLLVMPVDEPPRGEPTQTKQVELSEGRYIEVTLRYGHPWPMLEVVYEDPNFTAELLASASNEDELWESNAATDLKAVPVPVEVGARLDQLQASHLENTGSLALTSPRSILNRFTKAVVTVSRFLPACSWKRGEAVPLFSFMRVRPVWTRPGLITVIFSILLVGVLLYVRLNIAPVVSAANLIELASTAEQTVNGRTDRALYRVINLEERDHAGGDLIKRSRIEIWRDSARNLSVRRVYDEQGRLIAGEWAANHSQTDRIASRTIYHSGVVPRVESSLRSPQTAIANLELWQLEPSAADYSKLIGRMDAARVIEDSSFYIVSYAGRQPISDATLLQATLTLRKSDLHPVEQTLTVQRLNETRNYRVTESSFEQMPVHAVAPAVFEVNRELIGERTQREGERTNRQNGSQPSALIPALAVVATPELEIEVAYLLNQFRTKFGDQINLTRTPEGLLSVEAVVDTDHSKEEIARALSPVMNNAAVRIQISTVAEVLARQQQRSPHSVITREFSGSDNAIPAYADLYRYFSQDQAGKDRTEGAPAKDDLVEREVWSLTVRVVGRSRRVLSHAIELRQLKERISVPQLTVLTPSARARFFGMVHDHADALHHEVSLLGGELKPIFFSGISDAELGGAEISSEADLAVVIERLYKLAAANDQVIRSAFTASSEASAATILKGPRFQVSLVTAEKLASKIRQAAIALESRQ